MGKSSGQTIGYKYYMPLHFVSGISKGATAAGIGVRDCLFEVRVGDRAAWTGAVYDNGAISIDAPDLFGGDEKEGGISGTLEVMFGGPTQGVSAYLNVQQGSPQSAHRGLLSLVWQNGQVCSNNPYLKPWAFARRRITGGWHGECWNPATAAIVLEGDGGGSGGILDARFIGTGVLGAGNAASARPMSLDGVWLGAADVAVTPTITTAVRGMVRYGDYMFAAIASESALRKAAITDLETWSDGPTVPASTSPKRLVVSGTRLLYWHSTDKVYRLDSDADTTFDSATLTGGVVDNLIEGVAGNGTDAVAVNGYGQLWGSTGNADSFTVGANLFGSIGHTSAGAIDVNEDRFLVAGRLGAAFTDSGGASATPCTFPSGVWDSTFAPSQVKYCGNDRWLIAVSETDTGEFGLYKSTNNGVSIVPVTLPVNIKFSRQYHQSIAVDGISGRVYVFGEEQTTGTRHAFWSDDLEVWTEISLAGTNVAGIVAVYALGSAPIVANGRYCMNPAHIVYQCLTDPNCLGYPTAVIDAASFAAAADQLYAEGLGLNLKWTHQETIENFIGVVCDHAGMLLIKDRRTGLYKLRLLRDDYDIGELKVFTPSNSRILSLQRPSPADIVNELQVTFKDYKTFKEATIPVRDTAAIQAMGRVVSKPHSLTGLPTQELAVRCGMRDLAAMSTPLWRIDLAFLRDADTLEPGEPFVLDYPVSETLPDGLTVILRVADEINYGNAASGEISAKCVQDVFSLPDTGYTGTIEPIPEDSSEAVEAVATLLEVPYRDLVQAMPADELAALPEEAGYVAAAAVRPNAKHLNFELHTRIPPAAFALAGTGDFCGSALLLGPLEPLDVNAYITGGTDLDLLTIGSAAFLGEGDSAEMVRIDGVSNGLVHIARGCGDTVPRSWPAGTRLWGYDNFAAADTAQYIDGESVEGKVKTRTGKGLLADAIALVRTMAQRAARPYPPAQVKVDGVPVVAGNTTPVTLPVDPVPVGEPAPVSSSGTLPGGYVGVPYSNIGAFGDPWQDLGETSYRYVTGAFWPGASVHYGGNSSYGKWVNEITGIPLVAGTYSVTTRTESRDGFSEQTLSVTIAAKPAYAVLDLSRRPGWNSLAHSAALPPFTEVVSGGSPVVDCAGWTDGKRYCEFTVEEGASFGGVYLGVHAAGLDNLTISPSNPGTVTYTTPVGAGTYGVAYDTATGSFYMRDAGGWIFVGPTETAIKFGPTTSENGRFRFGASGGPEATITANFGNEPWVYGLPAGYSGVPMPATIIVPAIWDVQKLTVGSLPQVSRNADGSWNAHGNLITDDFVILGSIGKSSGKHQVEITVRDVRTESVGLALATFDRADGRLGEAGTEDSIGASYGAEGGTPMIHIRTCFAGVHTAYDHVWPLGSGHVSRFSFAQDHTAGTVAIYADGVLIRTLTGVPAATWYPAAAGGYGSNTTLIAAGLLYPVATYDDWTTTV